MLCMIRVYRDKQASVHWSAASNKKHFSAHCLTRRKPFVNRTFCLAYGLHRISLVRASKEMFRTVVFDALEGTRDGCVLCEQTRRRPIQPGLPSPAAPPCAAPPDPSVVCPDFGFDRFVIFLLFVLLKKSPQRMSLIRQSVRGRFFPGRSDPSAYHSARPCSRRRSAVRTAPPRLSRRMSGFWIRQVCWITIWYFLFV